jgi:smad nuclear-interacting protein 1
MKSSRSKRESRWGSQNQQHPETTASVSDEAAVQALLAEAGAKTLSHRPQQQQQKRSNSSSVNSSSKRSRTGVTYQGNNNKPSKEEGAGYYGPAGDDRKGGSLSRLNSSNDGQAGIGLKTSNESETDTAVEKQKPDFGLSGALLATDTTTTGIATGGRNVYRGVVLKFQEPPEARTPTTTMWRFYVFRGEEQVDTLHVSRQSAYLFGRDGDVADIQLQHPSCSSQHAVLQYRAVLDKETAVRVCRPYLMDLESTNGTFLNGVRLDSARYYQLKKGDVLRFGASAREYVLLTANSKTIE